LCGEKKLDFVAKNKRLVNKMSDSKLPKEKSEEGDVEEGLMRLKLPEETDGNANNTKSK